jgi:predicted Zn-dependent peptidase
MKKILIILLFSLFFLGSLMSSVLPKYFSETLENGLEVVVIPINKGSDVVSTNIVYKVGSRNEIMGKSGIAHMLEHMNFKSTKNLKAGEFDKIVKKFGGVNNASTSFDYTKYYIKSTSKNFKKSLELFSELMQNLKLNDKEFQKERDVVLEERLWRTDNSPMGWVYFNLFNHSFVYHPYHWTPIGFIEDIKNWTLKDIKKFHKKFYQPSNAVVIVAGDVNEEDVFEYTKKYFSHIPNGSKIEESYQLEPKQNGYRKVYLHKKSEVEILAMSFHTPNFEHNDQVVLFAIAELLGDGKSSILHNELVDKKKLVNSIYAYNMDLKDPGVFIILAMCNIGVDGESVEEQVLKVLKKLESISKEDLEKVKVNTKADFIFSLQNSSDVVSLFADYLARGNLDPLLNYEKDLEGLTKKKIIEVAKRYFTKDNLTTVILKDKK